MLSSGGIFAVPTYLCEIYLVVSLEVPSNFSQYVQRKRGKGPWVPSEDTS